MKNMYIIDNYLKAQDINPDKLLRLNSNGTKAKELGLHQGQVVRLRSYGMIQFRRPARKWYPGPDLQRYREYKRKKERR